MYNYHDCGYEWLSRFGDSDSCCQFSLPFNAVVALGSLTLLFLGLVLIPVSHLGVPKSADHCWEFDDTLEDPGKASRQ